MTNRQKAHFAVLCSLCQQKKRPVTAAELAEAEGIFLTAARRALNVLIFQGLVVWCRKGKKKYYWPRGWQSPRGGAGG